MSAKTVSAPSQQGLLPLVADLLGLGLLGRRTRTYGNGESKSLALDRAELVGADLTRAQLQGATLVLAQLQGVNLRKVENLIQDQINRACVDENTELPPALTRPAPCPTNP
jgi:uncharacterized protein YjbI with pentapeptide repeats